MAGYDWITEPLVADQHEWSDFDCAAEPHNKFMQRAVREVERGFCQVYVAIMNDGSQRVAGYYSINTFSVMPENVTRKMAGGVSFPVPALLIGQLAVDVRHGRQGLGSALAWDAQLRCLEISKSVGVRLVVVHPQGGSERIAAWWEKLGFRRCPVDPPMLAIPISTIQKATEQVP